MRGVWGSMDEVLNFKINEILVIRYLYTGIHEFVYDTVRLQFCFCFSFFQCTTFSNCCDFAG